MRHDDKELAKQIILEIIRQAGGVLNSKTRLFKAFYHAHVKFAETQPGYLSAWPIVRMPNGPGIDQSGMLLDELTTEGKIEAKPILHGNYVGLQFRVISDERQSDLLPAGAIDAISYGIHQIKGKSAKQVSDESHAMSRAWRGSRDGEELNIYLDSLSDEEYQKGMEDAGQIARMLIAAQNKTC
jgi:hypothetical protein